MDTLTHIMELPQYDENGRDLIRRAFARADAAHAHQKRADGSPYIVHPAAVASYLADLGFDAASVAAAFLHDVVEDCGVTRDELEREFGADVAFLVDGVTKLKAIPMRSAETESLKKMFFAMAEDLRVIMIKLADRLHNMRTLEYKEPAARTRKSLETLEIYAPIADRLGMGRMKGELEDLAFPYAHPDEYAWLKRTIRDRYEDRLKYIERVAPVVSRHLADAGIVVVDIHARAKRMWSLYQKLKRYGMDPDRVLDLVAMRIILPDVKSCYEALGAIHAHYKPMPGRVKDFIALPKPNGYRSLHTAVFCEKGRVAEIQLRTAEMHDHAENGVAAHWAYAEQGKHNNTSAKAAELAWINQLKTTLKDIKTSAGMANLKVDFFKNRIFALTPHGDVKDLPEGATPVDFAYTVHSGLGHRTHGAMVNGKLVPLTYRLQSGDVVEIQKTKDERPSKNWLRFVRTTHAAKHIRSWFKQHDVVEPTDTVRRDAPVRRARPKKGAGIPVRAGRSGVLIAGQPGLAYKLGKCCSPATDSPIIGYLTVSRGVTIHRTACANLKTAPERRLLDARWV